MMNVLVTLITAVVVSMSGTQTATVVETYDNVMIVETKDGNLWEYEFDEMSEREMYAELVLLVNDEVVVLA